MDRTEPTHPEKLRDATRVATIRLDRHRRKRRLHMTGLQQNRREAAFGQGGVKPLRQRSGLQLDPLDRKPKFTQKVDDPIWMAFDLRLRNDFAANVDDTDT